MLLGMRVIGLLLVVTGVVAGCASLPYRGGKSVGIHDEIVVAGRRFHTGTRVVLFSDSGGFSAYVPHRFFEPSIVGARDDPSCVLRYGKMRRDLPDALVARVEKRGWTVADLAKVVHQVVLHYDAAGSSRRCFEILQDLRGLSCHFLADTDGTVYQTLDVKERAWHAGPANDHSVGIEIANLGAYPDRADAGDGPLVAGRIREEVLWQRPFTNAQYAALGKLVATLCRVLSIPWKVPRGPDGKVLERTLPRKQALGYQGILGHFHVSLSKVDPGPAFDWDRLLRAGAR